MSEKLNNFRKNKFNKLIEEAVENCDPEYKKAASYLEKEGNFLTYDKEKEIINSCEEYKQVDGNYRKMRMLSILITFILCFYSFPFMNALANPNVIIQYLSTFIAIINATLAIIIIAKTSTYRKAYHNMIDKEINKEIYRYKYSDELQKTIEEFNECKSKLNELIK